MRLLSWLFGLPLAIVIVVFALSNRQDLTVGMWPFADGVALPIYLAVLGPLLCGFLLGALLIGFGGVKARAAARSHARRASALEREVETLRMARDAQPATSPGVSSPAGDVILPS